MVAMESCRACGGAWLARWTARLLLLKALPEPVVELSRVLSANLDAPRDTGYRTAARVAEHACPRCRAPLRAVAIAFADVTMAICSEHGAWFERDAIHRTHQAVWTIPDAENPFLQHFVVHATEEERQLWLAALERATNR
jgi:Zn-finger nucleic acid-binding protein